MPESALAARVVVLAGPSGSGKSRLAERLGLPVLRLDDFYKDGNDPSLPRIEHGANAGIVDWDHLDSWHRDQALATIEALCRDAVAEVPIYELAQDGRTGSQTLDLGDAGLFVAEGIFAQAIVPELREAGWLAAAVCVRRSAGRTFWLRLVRDLREHRKPPLVLIRRGLVLMGEHRQVVTDCVAQGCTPMTPDQAVAAIGGLAQAPSKA